MYMYNIFYNFTSSPKVLVFNEYDVIDDGVVSLKNTIDKAIIKYKAVEKNVPVPIMDVLYSSFPEPENRLFKGHDVVSVSGPLYFFIPPMLIFGLVLSEIVKEKEYRLRHGLNIIGVSHFAYWLS